MTMRTPVFDPRRLTPADWDSLAAADIHLRYRTSEYGSAWNTVRRLTGLDPESPEYARVIRDRIRPSTRDRAWRTYTVATLANRASDVDLMKAALRAHFG